MCVGGGEEESEKFPLSYKLRQEGGWRRVRNLQSAKSCPLPHPQTKRKLNLPMLYASTTPQRERERERERDRERERERQRERERDPLCFLCKHTMCSHKIRSFVYGKNLEKRRNHSTHQHSSNQKRKAGVQLQNWSTVEDMLSLKNSRLWKTDS